FVLEKRHGHNSNAEVNNFTSQAEFQSITYWNHDTTSSTEDSLPSFVKLSEEIQTAMTFAHPAVLCDLHIQLFFGQ
ncbi:hypothetical protein ACJX0J_024669, partial [Zea mays]